MDDVDRIIYLMELEAIAISDFPPILRFICPNPDDHHNGHDKSTV